MPHAVLLIERQPTVWTQVNRAGSPVLLLEEQGRQFFAEHLEMLIETDHLRNVEQVRGDRAQYLQSVHVTHNVESNDPILRVLRAHDRFDRISLDDRVVDVPAGNSETYLSAELDKMFPQPTPVSWSDFETWWAAVAQRSPIWVGRIIMAATVAEIHIDPSIQTTFELPIIQVLSELDQLERDGWRLVSVSEDRGVPDEDSSAGAFIVRARYMMVHAEPVANRV